MRIVDRLQSRAARWRLEHTSGVTIAPDARVRAGNVTMRRACRLEIGARSIVEANLDFERDGAALVVGANSYVGASTFKCAERIEIGDDVRIAWNCSIVDHDWEPLAWDERKVDMRTWYVADKDWTHVRIGAIHIGDRAVVGFGSAILRGVSIGEGAIVGVHSVVTRDVPPYAIVAGAPARVVRFIIQGTGSRTDGAGERSDGSGAAARATP